LGDEQGVLELLICSGWLRNRAERCLRGCDLVHSPEIFRGIIRVLTTYEESQDALLLVWASAEAVKRMGGLPLRLWSLSRLLESQGFGTQ
jgi:hypothetical protein